MELLSAGSHLNMKLHMHYIERTYLVRRMIITRPNSTNATLLICLYKIFVRPYMDYGCTALTTLSKTQRHQLEVVRYCCLHYAKRAVDSTCSSNNELHSLCNIVSVEQSILALGTIPDNKLLTIAVTL